MILLDILVIILGWLLLGFLGATIGIKVPIPCMNNNMTDDVWLLVFGILIGPFSILIVLVFIFANLVLHINKHQHIMGTVNAHLNRYLNWVNGLSISNKNKKDKT